ncbi:MAG: hypothetical protein PVH73_01170 [Candidatus Bathyarchaeota archaeon]
MELEHKKILIGVYLLVFMISLIVTSIITYFSNVDTVLIRALVYIGSSGGLGGIVYCIRGFYKNIVSKEFDTIWAWWYLFRPFISIVIGIFVYFLIVGGLLSLGAASTIDYSRSIMFYCAVAFLAGFAFTQFADKLDELASTLFAKKEEVTEK